MVTKVLRAKILFFDSNPVGRVLTRFSKDLAILDSLMPTVCVFATFGVFRSLTVMIVVIIINPWLAFVIALVVFLMYLVFKSLVGVMVESQRMDSIYRGPINSSFTNLVNGLVSVRTYERL
jgi:ABC-type multidrug transport system fused ATPase/permease subunit